MTIKEVQAMIGERRLDSGAGVMVLVCVEVVVTRRFAADGHSDTVGVVVQDERGVRRPESMKWWRSRPFV